MRVSRQWCGHRAHAPDDDHGAILILALVFLLIVSMTVFAVASLTTNAIADTVRFSNAQFTVTASNNAGSVAVQDSRTTFYQSTLNAYPPAPCGGTSSPTAITTSSVSMDAWCTTQWFPLASSGPTRVVYASICPAGTSPAACAAHPYLEVVLDLNDTLSTNYSSCSPITSASASSLDSSCGITASYGLWAFGTAPPVVTATTVGPQTSCSLVTGSGQTTPGEQYGLTLSGSAFSPIASGDAVTLVVSPLETYQATITTASATQISAQICVPLSVTPSGSSEYVVTTAFGASL